MTAFDTDVLTQILLGNEQCVARAAAIPGDQQAVPIVVSEEILRGRLSVIRRAEAGKAKIGIGRAYELLDETVADLGRLNTLRYSPEAEALYAEWRQQGIRISTHDLRIGAIWVAYRAKLVSRNRADFRQAPGLMVEFWA